MADGMSNLLQNKLLLQYMAGAGQDIAAGRPIGQNVNAITQQNIQSQNFMGLLQKMLSGQVPEGGKMTMDSKGMKLDIPSSLFGGQGFGEIVGEGGGGGTSTTPQQATGGTGGLANLGLGSNLLNPSISPAISGADLAGLTPEMISQALQFKFMQEEIGQKRATDLVDMMYKGALTEQARATTAAATPSITIPGTDIKLTGKQYINWYKTANKDERTAAIKNYEYAQTDKGGNFGGSFEDFQNIARTTHEKDYDRAVEDGYKGTFNEWLNQMVKSKAIKISIGEKAATAAAVKEATTDVDIATAGRRYFSKDWKADIDKIVDEDISLDPFFGRPEYALERAKLVEQKIESEIGSRGGKITSKYLDGRTYVFEVEWPDGKTSEVRYAN